MKTPIRVWPLLIGTPLGMFGIGIGTVVLVEIWQPSLPTEILVVFLALLLAISFAIQRIMYRSNLLGEGLHMHLDQSGPTEGFDWDGRRDAQAALLDEVRAIAGEVEKQASLPKEVREVAAKERAKEWAYTVEMINTEYDEDLDDIEKSPPSEQIIQRFLNDFSEDGWELVALIPAQPTDQRLRKAFANPWLHYAIFKKIAEG